MLQLRHYLENWAYSIYQKVETIRLWRHSKHDIEGME